MSAIDLDQFTKDLKKSNFIERLLGELAACEAAIDAQEGFQKFFTLLRLETGLETREQVLAVHRVAVDLLKRDAPVSVKTTLVHCARRSLKTLRKRWHMTEILASASIAELAIGEVLLGSSDTTIDPLETSKADRTAYGRALYKWLKQVRYFLTESDFRKFLLEYGSKVDPRRRDAFLYVRLILLLLPKSAAYHFAHPEHGELWSLWMKAGTPSRHRKLGFLPFIAVNRVPVDSFDKVRIETLVNAIFEAICVPFVAGHAGEDRTKYPTSEFEYFFSEERNSSKSPAGLKSAGKWLAKVLLVNAESGQSVANKLFARMRSVDDKEMFFSLWSELFRFLEVQTVNAYQNGNLPESLSRAAQAAIAVSTPLLLDLVTLGGDRAGFSSGRCWDLFSRSLRLAVRYNSGDASKYLTELFRGLEALNDPAKSHEPVFLILTGAADVLADATAVDPDVVAQVVAVTVSSHIGPGSPIRTSAAALFLWKLARQPSYCNAALWDEHAEDFLLGAVKSLVFAGPEEAAIGSAEGGMHKDKVSLADVLAGTWEMIFRRVTTAGARESAVVKLLHLLRTYESEKTGRKSLGKVVESTTLVDGVQTSRIILSYALNRLLENRNVEFWGTVAGAILRRVDSLGFGYLDRALFERLFSQLCDVSLPDAKVSNKFAVKLLRRAAEGCAENSEEVEWLVTLARKHQHKLGLTKRLSLLGSCIRGCSAAGLGGQMMQTWTAFSWPRRENSSPIFQQVRKEIFAFMMSGDLLSLDAKTSKKAVKMSRDFLGLKRFPLLARHNVFMRRLANYPQTRGLFHFELLQRDNEFHRVNKLSLDEAAVTFSIEFSDEQLAVTQRLVDIATDSPFEKVSGKAVAVVLAATNQASDIDGMFSALFKRAVGNMELPDMPEEQRVEDQKVLNFSSMMSSVFSRRAGKPGTCMYVWKDLKLSLRYVGACLKLLRNAESLHLTSRAVDSLFHSLQIWSETRVIHPSLPQKDVNIFDHVTQTIDVEKDHWKVHLACTSVFLVFQPLITERTEELSRFFYDHLLGSQSSVALTAVAMRGISLGQKRTVAPDDTQRLLSVCNRVYRSRADKAVDAASSLALSALNAANGKRIWSATYPEISTEFRSMVFWSNLGLPEPAKTFAAILSACEADEVSMFWEAVGGQLRSHPQLFNSVTALLAEGLKKTEAGSKVSQTVSALRFAITGVSGITVSPHVHADLANAITEFLFPRDKTFSSDSVKRVFLLNGLFDDAAVRGVLRNRERLMDAIPNEILDQPTLQARNAAVSLVSSQLEATVDDGLGFLGQKLVSRIFRLQNGITDTYNLGLLALMDSFSGPEQAVSAVRSWWTAMPLLEDWLTARLATSEKREVREAAQTVVKSSVYPLAQTASEPLQREEWVKISVGRMLRHLPFNEREVGVLLEALEGLLSETQPEAVRAAAQRGIATMLTTLDEASVRDVCRRFLRNSRGLAAIVASLRGRRLSDWTGQVFVALRNCRTQETKRVVEAVMQEFLKEKMNDRTLWDEERAELLSADQREALDAFKPGYSYFS